MDLLERASKKMEERQETTKKATKKEPTKTGWDVPEVKINPKKKDKTPIVEKEEHYEIQLVEDYQGIQEFKEFQYIPSKRAIDEAIDMYRHVMKSIIKPTDFHKIGDNQYLKRSGFRKIAQAFGITLEQIGEEEFFEADNVLHCKVKVRASLGHVDHKAIEIGMKLLIDSGQATMEEISKLLLDLSKVRHADGVGIVSLDEIKFDKNKTRHNLQGFAYTRGASRAIADLVGFGVVSATEVDVNEDKVDW